MVAMRSSASYVLCGNVCGQCEESPPASTDRTRIRLYGAEEVVGEMLHRNASIEQ